MNHRHLAPLLTVIALVTFAALPAVCQTRPATAGTWTAPLTSWGDPDRSAGAMEQPNIHTLATAS